MYNQSRKQRNFSSVVTLSLMGMMFFGLNSFSESEYAGLWVGRVAVSHVNEVAIPLDEDNTPIAPDPNTPTLAHDEAYLRLILHVNGAGQVNLLRDVAILSQSADGTSGQVAQSESDYVLVTDDRLYADFPSQEAIRIASAVFDFGDSKATDAVDLLVDTIVEQVALSVDAANITALSSDPDLRTAEDTAQLVSETAANLLIEPSDVNASFDAFLRDELPAATLTALVTTEPLDLSTVQTPAETLRDASFFLDTRAVDLLSNLAVEVNAATNNTLKRIVAHNLVSRYADIDNNYQRFITGRSFGDMIADAALLAAEASVVSNATEITVRNAVDTAISVGDVRTEAINMLVAAYEDTASTLAVEVVLDAIINTAVSSTEPLEGLVAVEAEKAGLLALEMNVPRYALHVQAPTDDYTDFVTSDSFSGAVTTAAEAAALAAVKEAKNDPFYSVQTLENAARIAAVESIRVPSAEAARARQTELPLEGMFAVGEGDSRLVSSISNQDAPLGSAALTGTIYLPASHPTNPFRHRRHPDHTVGFGVQRNLRIDFDSATSNQLTSVRFGVNLIVGVYREELFGLHKPLGPAPDTNPIGLKVEGKFELNRVSHIDTLNSL